MGIWLAHVAHREPKLEPLALGKVRGGVPKQHQAPSRQQRNYDPGLAAWNHLRLRAFKGVFSDEEVGGNAMIVMVTTSAPDTPPTPAVEEYFWTLHSSERCRLRLIQRRSFLRRSIVYVQACGVLHG